jgi:hypothetical protein
MLCRFAGEATGQGRLPPKVLGKMATELRENVFRNCALVAAAGVAFHHFFLDTEFVNVLTFDRLIL